MKQIPHSKEAERWVLWSIFLDKDSIKKVYDILTPSDFYISENSEIFSAMLELNAANTPIDMLTVREQLDDKQILEKIWWNKILIDIAESMFSISNVVQYAQIVKQKSILRKFIQAGNSIFLSWYNEDADIQELLWMVGKTYEQLASISETQEKVSKICDLIYTLQDEVEYAAEFWDKYQGYATGIRTIDKYTGGIMKGRTMRLSAYSNTWKSALSYFIVNSVLKQWAKVLYFSLEIPKEDLRNRLLSNYFKMPIQAFDTKKSLMNFDMSEYWTKELYIVSDLFWMSDIERITRSIKPDIVFIDYVQLVRWEWASEYEQMNDVARRIRKLTADNNCAVFDLSQVSNEGKEYKKWSVIPSKWSGELISAANVVLVMKEGETDWLLELIIAKNRHWKKGICTELKPDFRFSSFEDLGEIPWGDKKY